MQPISLLNSVIGPVMRGPSSSHAAGPYQIASTIRQLAAGCGERIERVQIAFDPAGSFAAVYTSQGSDEGFAAGFVGLAVTDESYAGALGAVAVGDPFPVEFAVRPLEVSDHPNRVEIAVDVRCADGARRADRFRAVSTGGGMFLIDRLDGAPLAVDGSGWTVIVEGDVHDARRVAGDWGDPSAGSERRLQFTLPTEPDPAALDALVALRGIDRVRVAAPCQLAVASADPRIPDAATLAADHDVDLAARALEIESARLGVSIELVRRHFEERLALMLLSVRRGLDADPAADRMALLYPAARRVAAAAAPSPIGSRFLQDAVAAALAVMEQGTNRGIVIAAPTAGSAGIVPGILHALARSGASEASLVDALQVMSLVGGVFAQGGTFAAEMGGCSVETGASAAMAAGGLTHCLGGSGEQVFQAASLCLMNTLGLVCDPVAGEVEIPCHARNIAGVSHAHVAALATLSGFDAVMPFDHMVRATVNVGRLMHADLRCTSRGGCAEFCPGPRGARSRQPVDIQLAARPGAEQPGGQPAV